MVTTELKIRAVKPNRIVEAWKVLLGRNGQPPLASTVAPIETQKDIVAITKVDHTIAALNAYRSAVSSSDSTPHEINEAEHNARVMLNKVVPASGLSKRLLGFPRTDLANVVASMQEVAYTYLPEDRGQMSIAIGKGNDIQAYVLQLRAKGVPALDVIYQPAQNGRSVRREIAQLQKGIKVNMANGQTAAAEDLQSKLMAAQQLLAGLQSSYLDVRHPEIEVPDLAPVNSRRGKTHTIGFQSLNMPPLELSGTPKFLDGRVTDYVFVALSQPHSTPIILK